MDGAAKAKETRQVRLAVVRVPRACEFIRWEACVHEDAHFGSSLVGMVWFGIDGVTDHNQNCRSPFCQL